MFLFLNIEGCSRDSSQGTVISAEAIGNWVNFSGAALEADSTEDKKISPRNCISINPTLFYIDIRTVKMKTLKRDWVTLLEKGHSDKREIIGMATIAPRSLIPSGEYTAIQVGYDPEWFIMGSFTNSAGKATNFILTNRGSSHTHATEYILFGTPEAVKEINTSTNMPVSLFDVNSFSLAKGDYRVIYLYFDTLGMIHIYTNNNGNITNIIMDTPTIQIDIR